MYLWRYSCLIGVRCILESLFLMLLFPLLTVMAVVMVICIWHDGSSDYFLGVCVCYIFQSSFSRLYKGKYIVPLCFVLAVSLFLLCYLSFLTLVFIVSWHDGVPTCVLCFFSWVSLSLMLSWISLMLSWIPFMLAWIPLMLAWISLILSWIFFTLSWIPFFYILESPLLMLSAFLYSGGCGNGRIYVAWRCSCLFFVVVISLRLPSLVYTKEKKWWIARCLTPKLPPRGVARCLCRPHFVSQQQLYKWRAVAPHNQDKVCNICPCLSYSNVRTEIFG